MKFILKNGKVQYLMVAGQDTVSGEMELAQAAQICKDGRKQASDRFPGYPICVNDQYFFAVEQPPATPRKGKRKNA